MYYVLSEHDKIEIEKLLSKERSRRNPSRTPPSTERSQSPEVYIARTPRNGIPALALEPGTASGEENDQPGYADCTIYQVIGEGSVPTLIQTGAIPQRVYNLTVSDLPGYSWVLAIRDKYGVYCAVRMVSGRTECVSFNDPCTGKRKSLWFEAGVLTSRTDPCPECEEIPDEDTGTGTGTGTTDTPVVDLACPGATVFPSVPTELCLAPIPFSPGTIGSSIATVGGSTETWGCPTTWGKTVRLTLQMGESDLTGSLTASPHLVYRGQSIGPPGSLEGGAFDPNFYGPGFYNQACSAVYTLTIRCYDSTKIIATLAGMLGWRHLDEHGFDAASISGGLSNGYTLFKTFDPANWGGSINLEFSYANDVLGTPAGFSGGIETWRITSGPCVPCPYPPIVNYSTYSITGTTPYVTIEGSFPNATLSNTTVTFNLGAAGIVTEIWPSTGTPTKLTVLFTTHPTSTGALTAIVVVDGCCNSGPGTEAILPDDSEPGTGTTEYGLDIIVPLVIATPFDIGGV